MRTGVLRWAMHWTPHWALALAVLAAPAGARTLTAGPGQEHDTPSAAARAAGPGDTVLIEPGTYYDCVVSSGGITLAGRGPGVVLTDTTCQGKGILVLSGAVTVRDLTLSRARVADGNGAAARLEGADARFERVRFTDNQAGILGAAGRLEVVDCVFEGGGVGGERPTYAISVGPADSVEVSGTTFGPTRGGQVRAVAQRIVVRNSTLDLAVAGAAIEARGTLLLEGATVRLLGDASAGARVTDGTATLRRNRLVNETGRALPLLIHWGAGTPIQQDNVVPPGDMAVSTSGAWRNEASEAYHGARDTARRAAGAAKGKLRDWLQ